MTGLLLNKDGDLLVTVKSAGKKGLTVGETDGQTIEMVLRATPGEFKHAPLIGAGITQLLGGAPSMLWCAETRDMLAACGVPAASVEIDNDNVITIT